jgi:hypothetical protein
MSFFFQAAADHIAKEQDLVTKEELHGVIGLLRSTLSDAAAAPALGSLFAFLSVALCLSLAVNYRQWRSAREKEEGATADGRVRRIGGEGRRLDDRGVISRGLSALYTSMRRSREVGPGASVPPRRRSRSPAPPAEDLTAGGGCQQTEERERETETMGQINIIVERE